MDRKPISAMFDTYEAATRCVERLKASGIPESDISIVGGDERMRVATDGSTTTDTTYTDTESNAAPGTAVGAAIGGGAGLLAGLGLLAIPGIGPVVAAGWLASTLLGAVAGGAAGGIIGALTDAGVSEEEAHTYAEGIRRGGTLVTVNTDSARAPDVMALLDEEGAIDMNQRTDQWRNEGWSGRYEATDTPITRGGTGSMGAAGSVPVTGSGSGTSGSGYMSSSREDTIPIIEEQAEIGKRSTERQVRVHTDVVETPIERQVTLEQETVRPEVRKVDRPATEADFAAQGRTLQATERVERPVVDKTARVVEEVSLKKDVDQHSETVRDTVKRTDVEIEDERAAQSDRTTKRSS